MITKLKEKYFTRGQNPCGYKGYIFDLDGTLLDSKRDIVEATNATIIAMGGEPLEASLIESFVGHGVRSLIQKALKDVEGANVENTLRYFTNYYLQNGTKHSRFFKGADEFLICLKNQNKRCGLLTNKPQNHTDNILNRLDKNKYFDFVLGAENGYPCKPDTQGFMAILKDWNLKAEDILYFGDSDVDAQTAQNAGCDLALYLDGYIPEADLVPYYDYATVAFRDYEQLQVQFVKERVVRS